ncbi:hypothetical protein, partial [Streptomyces sp. NPDC003668]
EYAQYEDDPPPCDAPHLTPRADPPGITGQPLVELNHAGSREDTDRNQKHTDYHRGHAYGSVRD